MDTKYVDLFRGKVCGWCVEVDKRCVCVYRVIEPRNGAAPQTEGLITGRTRNRQVHLRTTSISRDRARAPPSARERGMRRGSDKVFPPHSHT